MLAPVAVILALCLLAAVAGAAALGEAPKPSTPQQRMLRHGGLAQFMHFSVDPFTSIEHNCVGTSDDCIPASKFNPTNLSTDQWVQSAAAFGAKEICLTAHHEGGFCLWDTKFSNCETIFHAKLSIALPPATCLAPAWHRT